jgi:hypothetical protein
VSHPTLFTWDAEAGVMVPRWPKLAASRFSGGEDYALVAHEHRSDKTHRHEFAWLREAWANLPEALADQFPTPEHLRKRGLISTGFCNVTDYPCGSRAEALRWAANLRREADDYAVVVVSESVVRVMKAKSQSRRAVDAREFQASKTALLEWCAGLIGVAPETLGQAREAA